MSLKNHLNFERIILGIDPGTNVMGYAVIGIHKGKPALIEMNALHLEKVSDNYLKLSSIYNTVQQIVEDYLPDEMAIEAPFYGKNVQSMLKLGRAQGVAMAAVLSRQVPITEYEPRKVKLSITGNGGASKEQVKEMLKRLLNLQNEDLKTELDASDALAIALCHFYESNKIISSGAPKSWEEFISLNPGRVKKQ